MLQDDGKKEEYAERAKQLWAEGVWDNGEWEKMNRVMLRAAMDVCSVSERGLCLTPG